MTPSPIPRPTWVQLISGGDRDLHIMQILLVDAGRRFGERQRQGDRKKCDVLFREIAFGIIKNKAN